MLDNQRDTDIEDVSPKEELAQDSSPSLSVPVDIMAQSDETAQTFVESGGAVAENTKPDEPLLLGEADKVLSHKELNMRARFSLFLKRREIKRFIKYGYRLVARGKKSLDLAKLDEARAALCALKAKLTSQDIAELNAALKNADTVLTCQLRSVKKSASREVVESLVFALVFALILRTFFVEPFQIPTRSMVPTLLDGDRLFVTKLSYGIRIPFLDDYIVQFSKPQRGEVVVFAFPQKEAAEHLARSNYKCMQAESIAGEKDYIKRIIGVEGDSIEVIDQIVHVNGEPIAQQAIYQREVADYFYLSDRRRETWNYETHGDAQYTTITHSISQNHFGPIKVAAGNVFVMGDNRDNSSDSRCWGQVPVRNIKGRAQILWWSAGSHGTRWTRIFTRIH